MNKNNSKSSNNNIHLKNNNINKDIIDLSNNFHNLFDNSKTFLILKTNQLHPPVEKTIEQLIDEYVTSLMEY